MSPCYHEYYLTQAGGGVGAIYRGSVYQKGNGFGSFFKGLFRSVMPLIKSGLRTLGQETLRSGSNILGDMANDRPLGDVLKTRITESAENLKRKAQDKIEKLIGSGRTKRKRKSFKSQKRSVRRRVNSSKFKDIVC